MSLLDCVGCGAVIPCGNIDDQDLYSLEDVPLPFVFDCPPPLDCSGAEFMYLQCCKQVIFLPFPSGIDPVGKQALIDNAVAQCQRIGAMCIGLPKGPPSGPPTTRDPTQLFFNRPQTCTVICPDGNQFSYTIRQGVTAGFSQAAADALAKAIACQQATAKRICLSSINTKCCVGTAFTTTVHASSGISNFTWAIVSGALPDGLLLGGFGSVDATVGPAETIEGTPTVAGTFNFTLKVTDGAGNSMSKAYTMCASDVLPHTLPHGKVGNVYSQTFTDTTCIGTPVTWSVTVGTLPNGLTLNGTTGVLSGTPTTAATSNFTVKATGPSGTCSRACSVVVDAATLDFVYVNAGDVAALVGCLPAFTQRFTRVGSHFNNDGNGSWVLSASGIGNPWEFLALPNVIYDGPLYDGTVNSCLGVYTNVGSCGAGTITIQAAP